MVEGRRSLKRLGSRKSRGKIREGAVSAERDEFVAAVAIRENRKFNLRVPPLDKNSLTPLDTLSLLRRSDWNPSVVDSLGRTRRKRISRFQQVGNSARILWSVCRQCHLIAPISLPFFILVKKEIIIGESRFISTAYVSSIESIRELCLLRTRDLQYFADDKQLKMRKKNGDRSAPRRGWSLKLLWIKLA